MQQDDLRSTGQVLLGSWPPAELRLDSQKFERTCRHLGDVNGDGFTFSDQGPVMGIVEVADHLKAAEPQERPVVLYEVPVGGGRERNLVVRSRRDFGAESCGDHDEAVCLRVRQRPQQDPIDDRESGGIGSYGYRQSQDGHDGEHWRFAECSKRHPDIVARRQG
jgi:hypothetical protein